MHVFSVSKDAFSMGDKEFLRSGVEAVGEGSGDRFGSFAFSLIIKFGSYAMS